MDWGRNLLHYPNMRSIPVYSLYGENGGRHGEESLHWETIQSRSRLHGYRIAPHRHEAFFQLLLMTGGRAQATLDGAEVDLLPPAAVVVPALTVHGYVFSPDVDGVVLTLMEREIADGLAFPEARVLPGGNAVREELGRLIAEADRPAAGHDLAGHDLAGHDLAMRARITLLLLALHRAAREPPAAGRPADRARVHVQAFRALVHQRFRETRSIADYAATIGISPTHLNRVCRQVLGSSALAVIERRIGLEARRQLRFSSLSIKEIGSALGYDDPAYFTRFVTRALGMSPRAFRERIRQG